MKIDANSLPNDPEQLKQMLLELQQRIDEELAKKDAQIHELLQRYKDKLAKEYGKKSEKMPLGKAITYALNQFEKFQRYLDDGNLKIDNNRAERAIKPFVMGRKAWLFSNTCNGARASSILFSLVETAKANGLVVHDYISHCLQYIAEQPNDLESLLPWNVKRD